MKTFVLVFAVIIVMVARVISEEVKKKKEVSNDEITEVLKRILKRLDTIEDNVRANREETKEVRNEVKANREVLLKLDTQMKMYEAMQVITMEKKESSTNTKSVNKLSELVNVSLHNVSRDVSDIKAILTEVLPGRSETRPARSCSWIKTHSYCIRSGQFWIQNGGKSSLQFCEMDDDQPVTTSGVPTKVQSTQHPSTIRPTTVQLTTVLPTTAPPTTERPTTVHPTEKPIYRGTSCKELKNRYPHLKSGIYNVSVEGSTFGAFCDMDTDEGGWTMIGSAVVNNESEAKEVELGIIQRDDYRQLQQVTSGRFILSNKGLNLLYNAVPFTEIRFECYKPYHGRRLHLKTKGIQVVEWLLQKRRLTPEPQSCGTFSRLKGDSSYIGGHCGRWRDGHWQRAGLYHLPMLAVDDRTGLHYDLSLDFRFFYALYCDDHKSHHSDFKNSGHWTYYVK